MSTNYWSVEEIEILKKYYPTEGIEGVLLRLPNRTSSGVQYKLYTLGLKNDGEPKVNKWTEEELNILRLYYPTEGKRGVHKRLPHRTESSIKTRAGLLGISVQKRKSDIAWSNKEIELLTNYYPIGGIELCKQRGLSRSDSAIQSKAYSIGLTYKPEVYPVGKAWQEWELNILYDYYILEGVDELSRKLNRTKGAIYNMVRILGLTREYNPKMYIEGEGFWTTTELAILKKHYPYGGSKACIENGLKRDVASIFAKARSENIKCEYIDSKVSNFIRRNDMWSKQELEILLSKYSTEGANGVSKYINRPISAITSKANKMGLSVKDDCRASIKWSEVELNIVKSYYNSEGVDGCIKRGVVKTPKAIQHKASEFGLTNKRIPWTSEEEAIILKYYAIEGAKGCKQRGVNKTEKAIEHRAKKLGVYRKTK